MPRPHRRRVPAVDPRGIRHDVADAEAQAEAQAELIFPEGPSPTVIVTMLPIDRLHWVEVQPPAPELVESVRQMGVLQSVVVIAERGRHPQYRVVAGTRRCIAARTVGVPAIPAMVFPPGTTERQAIAMALAENLHRAPNPLHEAYAIHALMEQGYDAAAIARQLHLTELLVRRRHRILRLSATIHAALGDGRLPPEEAQRIADAPPAAHEAIERTLEAEPAARVTPRGLRSIIATMRRQLQHERTLERMGQTTIIGVDVAGDVSRDRPVVTSVLTSMTGEADFTEVGPDVNGVRLVAPLPEHHDTAFLAVTPYWGEEAAPGRHWFLVGGHVMVTQAQFQAVVDQLNRVSRLLDESEARNVELAQQVLDMQAILRAEPQTALPAPPHAPSPAEREAVRTLVQRAAAAEDRARAVQLLVAEESWPAVALLLDAADRAMPTEPTNDADTFHAQIGPLVAIARRRAVPG